MKNFTKIFQINIKLKPNQKLTGFAGLSEVVFPILWVDETVTINDENADYLKFRMSIPLLVSDILIYGVGFALSGIGILIGLIFKLRLLMKKKQGEPWRNS